MTDKDPEDLVGESFDRDEVPSYPGRIYYYNGEFIAGNPRVPVKLIQVRFRRAYPVKDEHYTVCEARRVDLSCPDDVYGEWVLE